MPNRRNFLKAGVALSFLAAIPAAIVSTMKSKGWWVFDGLSRKDYATMKTALEKVRAKGQFDYGKGYIGWNHGEYADWNALKDAALKVHEKGRPFDYSAKGARIGDSEAMREASKRKLEVHELLKAGKFKA